MLSVFGILIFVALKNMLLRLLFFLGGGGWGGGVLSLWGAQVMHVDILWITSILIYQYLFAIYLQ